MTTETAQVVRFSVDLPPTALRSNARSHWSEKKRAADSYSEDVWRSSQDQVFANKPADYLSDLPWRAARVTFTWRYCGTKPDHANLGGNTKHLLDIICKAPEMGIKQAQKYSRWHLGIVENDREIEAVFKLEKVAHKDQQSVLVEIERL